MVKPGREDLHKYFTTEFITSEIAEVIVYAFEQYEHDEFDVCGHLLIPRIEAIFRDIARQMGLPIYKEPKGREPGGVVTLGGNLENFTGHIDESWRRYFINLLTNPIPINLRNRICHGLIELVSQQEASLLLHLVSNLRLLGLKE